MLQLLFSWSVILCCNCTWSVLVYILVLLFVVIWLYQITKNLRLIKSELQFTMRCSRTTCVDPIIPVQNRLRSLLPKQAVIKVRLRSRLIYYTTIFSHLYTWLSAECVRRWQHIIRRWQRYCSTVYMFKTVWYTVYLLHLCSYMKGHFRFVSLFSSIIFVQLGVFMHVKRL